MVFICTGCHLQLVEQVIQVYFGFLRNYVTWRPRTFSGRDSFQFKERIAITLIGAPSIVARVFFINVISGIFYGITKIIAREHTVIKDLRKIQCSGIIHGPSRCDYGFHTYTYQFGTNICRQFIAILIKPFIFRIAVTKVATVYENELRHYGHLLYFEYCEEYILSDNHSRFFRGFWIENPVARQMYYSIIIAEKILDYAFGICSYKTCGRITYI